MTKKIERVMMKMMIMKIIENRSIKNLRVLNENNLEDIRPGNKANLKIRIPKIKNKIVIKLKNKIVRSN